MPNEETSDSGPKRAAVESFANLLENVAPGEFRDLPEEAFTLQPSGAYSFSWPPIQIYCAHEDCDGVRYADSNSSSMTFSPRERENRFTSYRCRNCNTHLKFFAVIIFAPDPNNAGTAVKVGELPLFGPHVSKHALQLLGSDVEQFRKGFRAESQGLGIAAAAYYRRVVENQRTHLFDQIIIAAESVNAGAQTVERLKHLREHWRFQQSIDEIKDCIPQILLIEGQNPLELLHPVLSDSLHDRTDEEALEIASEIRLVLINLAERIALAKTQSNELKQAVAKLAARKAARGKPQSIPTETKKP